LLRKAFGEKKKRQQRGGRQEGYQKRPSLEQGGRQSEKTQILYGFKGRKKVGNIFKKTNGVDFVGREKLTGLSSSGKES